MIKPKSISGFPENLPERQILEDSFKEIIKKNYSLSGFTPLDTPIIESLEVLTAKGADDNEIYGIHRAKEEGKNEIVSFSGLRMQEPGIIENIQKSLSKKEDSNGFGHSSEGHSKEGELGLRFDLTIPLARYVAQYEGELTFPFRRQHIGRVYRGERPQKGRFREFYQCDVDIIGNGELPLFADIEVISTISNALKELNFGDFQIHINNKKFLSGFLENLHIKNIPETISIIDKKNKVHKDKLTEMFQEIGLNHEQIEVIFGFIKFGEEHDSEKILSSFSQIDNKLLKEGIEELKFVYNGLLDLGISQNFIKIDPSISRGLNYYTGIVFETFIVGAENLGSIASGGRYENLAQNFTKNNYPGVGGSIGLTRLLAVLESIGKLKTDRKTISQVLVLHTGEKTFAKNLEIVKILRENGINTEMFLEDTKFQKQLKYANNKKIPFAIICGDEELEKGIIQLKNLDTGKQEEIKDIEDLIKNIK